MTKLTEKQLFQTYLDIYYADKMNEEIVSDLTVQLTEAKRHQNKTKKLLIKAAEHYKAVYGREPSIKKR